RDGLNLIEARAVDCLQLDVTRCGGITGFLELAAAAHAHNLEVSAHCAPQLSAHVLCAIPGARHIEWFHDHVRADRKLFDHVLEPDPDRRLARVQPGCVLDHLRGEAARHGLTFGPDPSTHAYCTLGGMVGNNSCGRHSIQAEFHGPGPRVADNLVELEVLTYRGERLRIGRGGAGVPDAIAERLRALAEANQDEIRARYPQIPRRVSGYNLDELLPENGFEVGRSLVGTESTCVTILEATLELISKPPCVSLLVVGYPDKFRTADHVTIAREHEPISIEGMDDTLIEDMTLLGIHEHERSMLPEGGGWLFVEFGGETKEESDAKARALMKDLEKNGRPPSGMKLYDDPD